MSLLQLNHFLSCIWHPRHCYEDAFLQDIAENDILSQRKHFHSSRLFTRKQNEPRHILCRCFIKFLSRGSNCVGGWFQTFSLHGAECIVTTGVRPRGPSSYSESIDMNRRQKRVLMSHMPLSSSCQLNGHKSFVCIQITFIYILFLITCMTLQSDLSPVPPF